MHCEICKLYNETRKASGLPEHEFDSQISDSERANPDLIRIIENLRDKADGDFAKLRIIEIPDGISWIIEEYDGVEHISEPHRTWY